MRRQPFLNVILWHTSWLHTCSREGIYGVVCPKSHTLSLLHCISSLLSDSNMPHVKSCSQLNHAHVASYIFSTHYLHTITPASWYLSFWMPKRGRSKGIVLATCLRCSVATQAKFSSSAFIAYMWRTIASHSVGGWKSLVLHPSLSLDFCRLTLFVSSYIFVSLLLCSSFFLYKSAFIIMSPMH